MIRRRIPRRWGRFRWVAVGGCGRGTSCAGLGGVV